MARQVAADSCTGLTEMLCSKFWICLASPTVKHELHHKFHGGESYDNLFIASSTLRMRKLI